jgi:hypothetical protein
VTRCPHCFHVVAPDRSAFVCVGDCEEVPDAQLSRYHGFQRNSRALTLLDRPAEAKGWVVPETVGCRKCSGPAVECCRECHYVFPPQWRRGEAMCVGFAGPRYAGKTNTIATLVHAMEQFATARGWMFSHATGISRDTYEKHYQDELFRNRGLFPPTARATVAGASQREPIIINLGVVGGRNRYVVLRDSAGEEWEEQADPIHLGFFSRANLVVFLFDPTQVQEVKDQVRDDMPVNELDGNPLQVLEHLQRLIGNGSPRLAITLAKLDALWMVGNGVFQAEGDGHAMTSRALALAMANTGSALRADLPLMAPSKEIDDSLALVNHEARSLLMLLRANALINAVERSPRGSSIQSAYFALSALGHPPTAQGVSPYGIAPYRVLDPILWMMRDARLI